MVAAAPVPVLPDASRVTTYAPVAATGPFPVGFDLYGDSGDYTAWVIVTLNGVQQVGNWTLDSPSGSLISLARPISDARIFFTTPITGALAIIGAQRPRRLAQLSENQGVTARDFNQAYTALIAMLREAWDARGRAIQVPAGETAGLLPSAATRALQLFGFDGAGNPIAAQPSSALVSAAMADVVAAGSHAAALALLGGAPASAIIPIGGEIDWPSIIVPPLWLPSDGTVRLRASFPELFDVVAPVYGAVVTGGSDVVTGIGDTNGWAPGFPVESVNIAPGTTILNILGPNSIQLNAPAIGAWNAIRVYPYGNGDGVTTFTLPSSRGMVYAGLDIAQTLLAGSHQIGARLGVQTATLGVGNLPAHSHPVTDPTHINPIASKGSPAGILQGPGTPSGNPQYANFGAGATDAAATGITVGNTGSSTPFAIVQPTTIRRKIIYAGR